MRIAIALAAVTAAACSGAAPPPPPGPVAPPAPPAAPADPYAALNLGVEDGPADAPAAWQQTTKGYDVRAVTDVHRGGARSLRVRVAEGNDFRFGAAAVKLDVRPLAGKRLRVHGWIRTEGVVDGAAVWLRIDGSDGPIEGAIDNMAGRQITGTTAWTEGTVEVVVPAGAESARLGALLRGPGTAWFDDLRIEIGAVEPPRRIVLAGAVVDPSGAPAVGAEVALVGGDAVVQHVRADAAGKFQFEAMSGHHGVSAHKAGAVGAFFDPRPFSADQRDLRIALGKDGGVTVRGTTKPRLPAGTYLQISPLSQHHGDLFAVPIGADGTFEAVLPRGDRYFITVLDGAGLGDAEFLRTGDRLDATLAVAPNAPPPAEVVDYIGKQAIALTTVEAGNGFADLAPLGKLIRGARVVALGEATHGSREMFQLKHRMLEYLVAQHGFTIFAIEANQPECRAINDYVVHGKGTARAALAGIYFWTWNTEEVLAMIEWMRAWNADPKHTAKVQFVGYDMQTPIVAHATVDAFLRKHAAAEADALLAPIALLGKETAPQAIAAASADERARIEAALAAIAKAFDRNRAAWARSPGFADARHDVAILDQSYRLYAAPTQSRDKFLIRDLAMADNLGWVMDQQPRARVVAWAHNGHVSNTLQAFTNMGSHLRKRLGARYVNLGFVFGEGGFQATDMTTGTPKLLTEFTLGPPPEAHASVAFARTGKPLLVLDLRALPARGPVRDWFAAPHPVREIGSIFASEASVTTLYSLVEMYDAVIFIARTTRARPLPKM